MSLDKYELFVRVPPMSIDKNHIAIGLGAAALVCGLSKCPDEFKGEGIKPAKVSNPVTKRQRDIGIDWRIIIDSLVEDAKEDDEEQTELTVEVPVGEDCNIPADFLFGRAIRDCIESSGELKCIGGLGTGIQSCFGVDSAVAKLPIFVDSTVVISTGSQVIMPLVLTGDTEDNFQEYEYNSHNPDASRDQLNQLCRDAVQLYLDSEEFDPDGSGLAVEYTNRAYDLFDLQDEFIELVGQSGLELVDLGGTEQIMWLNQEKVRVGYSFAFVRTDPIPMYSWGLTVDFAIGDESESWHFFPGADEALEFLLDAE